jgi:hypothetical protein
MGLAGVVKGRIQRPVRVLMYGVEGVGKSTFAADAPASIFLGTEDGTSQLDVARFPDPTSWQDAHDALDELRRSEHDYRTLAIDTLDWLEPLCWEHVCAHRRDKNNKKHDTIEGYPYGQGYQLAVDEWRGLCAHLNALLSEKKMNIVLVAHSQVRMFKNPAGPDYDRYELKLHAKSSGLLKEWADCVLFATHEELTRDANGRAKGVSTGARVIYTQRTAAWDAKNRYDLPETLPLSWEAFADAARSHRPADPARLVLRIGTLLDSAPEEVRPRVMAAVEKADGSAAELARIADKLAAMVSISSKEESKQ